MLELKDKRIILASSSPRRKQLLSLMDIPFICALSDNKEVICKELTPYEAVADLAKQKSDAIMKNIDDNDIVITADTIVLLNNQILVKPIDKTAEKEMLQALSGASHEVVSGVCIADKRYQDTFYDVTKVKFSQLSEDDIEYYISRYNPIDKAGAYGIQEWIGAIGIEKIDGSYYNVMGLPTEKLYAHLKLFLKHYE